MADIKFENVTCRYQGAETASVRDLTLDIADGEFLVLVGPSGCGKSTTLRMLAGLEDITSGRILIDGKDVTQAAPKDRDIAMVFQNYALYPHMSVRENIAFPLKVAKYPKNEIARRVKKAARLLDLTDYLDRKPKALSGGQRQRVAMGRAFVRQPRAFLMDEPLSNLDAKLRVQTRTQISELTQHLGVTTLYVTHDQTEAMTMGDRVAVLKDGILQQVDTPGGLYDHPANEFVASFMGSPSMNIFTCSLVDGSAQFGSQTIPLAENWQKQLREGRVLIGLRPENLVLCQPQQGIRAHITLVEELGADAYIYAQLTPEQGITVKKTRLDQPAQVIMRVPGRSHLKHGTDIWLASQGKIHFFDPTTGKNLAQ